MSTQQLTDMSAFEEALIDEGRSHYYPTFKPYRRSGVESAPQIGDVAWCGHIKTLPPGTPGAPRACEHCLRIRKLHGARERP